MAEKYTVDDKLQAAIAYVITGDSLNASKLCGIPDRTIRAWTATEWWDDILAEANASYQSKLDAVWTKILHKASDKMVERIEQGDPVVDAKTREVRYVPVKLRDLAIATAVMTDKRSLMRGQATRRTETVSVEKRLNKLSEHFENTAAKAISEEAVEEAASEA